MNFLDQLRCARLANHSLLCVGLDPEPSRFPAHLNGKIDKTFEFCASIVDACADVVIAFKPQIAYFSAIGAEKDLERLMRHMNDVAPKVPIILDAKRGDIGSTAEQYAIEAFERYGADALTLSPYMGLDSITPYLKYHDKGAFLLCRTSNAGGADLQNLMVHSHPQAKHLYEHVAHQAQHHWNLNGQLGLVVGATYPEDIERVRRQAPTLPLLIPGIGAQGGDAHRTLQSAWVDEQTPVVINSSRAVLYASATKDYAQAARSQALQARELLEGALKQHLSRRP
jgi:orotidine-5'-phosphate decarboxylase